MGGGCRVAVPCTRCFIDGFAESDCGGVTGEGIFLISWGFGLRRRALPACRPALERLDEMLAIAVNLGEAAVKLDERWRHYVNFLS